ncbi:MAG TPA: sigma-70 family RNA polymerase sigma factor [Pseudonocardia sp.]|nr:sigma-70 family RNA polymerase sigma factor [Pseudonocardia sp.]
MSLAPNPIRPVTTTELLCAAREGDAAAWEQLVRRFEPVLASVVRPYRLQEADARDAIQRTWLRLFEHHRQLREPEALPGWLATTARRECLRILNGRPAAEPLAAVETFVDPSADVEQRVVNAMTARRLRELMTHLHPRARALMYALFDDNPPGYAELARRTGIPVGSIGPTRARALRQLRALFGEASAGAGAGAGVAA